MTRENRLFEGITNNHQHQRYDGDLSIMADIFRCASYCTHQDPLRTSTPTRTTTTSATTQFRRPVTASFQAAAPGRTTEDPELARVVFRVQQALEKVLQHLVLPRAWCDPKAERRASEATKLCTGAGVVYLASAREAVGSKKEVWSKDPTRLATGDRRRRCVCGCGKDPTRIAIGAPRMLVVVPREKGLFGRWIVEGREWGRPR